MGMSYSHGEVGIGYGTHAGIVSRVEESATTEQLSTIGPFLNPRVVKGEAIMSPAQCIEVGPVLTDVAGSWIHGGQAVLPCGLIIRRVGNEVRLFKKTTDDAADGADAQVLPLDQVDVLINALRELQEEEHDEFERGCLLGIAEGMKLAAEAGENFTWS